MCQFFSFLSDGHSKIYYFNADQRRACIRFYDGTYVENYDSHTSIARYYRLNEDDWSKFEYNPFSDELILDQQNTTVDIDAVCDIVSHIDWNNWFDGKLVALKEAYNNITQIKFLHPDGSLQNNDNIKILPMNRLTAGFWPKGRFLAKVPHLKDIERYTADIFLGFLANCVPFYGFEHAFMIRYIYNILHPNYFSNEQKDYINQCLEVYKHGYGIVGNFDGKLYCFEPLS